MSTSTDLQPVKGRNLDGPETETIDLYLAYILADTSFSVADFMTVVNEGTNGAIDLLARHSAVTDQIRLSVLSFSDDAHIEIPAASPNNILTDAHLVANGSTNYHTGFDLLAATIPSDLAALVAERDRLQAETGRKHRIVRPAVFMVSDGAPTDGRKAWKASYDALMRLSACPNIVTFGVEDADEQVMREIATVRHYQAEDGADVAAVIQETFAAISRSLIDSATAGQGFIFPDQVAGTTAMDPFLDL